MGNGLTSLEKCFAAEASRRYDVAVICSDEMIDEGFGHSFCYIRPEYQYHLPSSKVYSEESYQTTTFRSISGASVSANTFTPLSTSLVDVYSYSGFCDKASAFESSISFASVPLQPVPKSSNLNYYNSLSAGKKIRGFPGSGPIEKGFLSGPIERGFASGPIERGLYSGPMDKTSDHNQKQAVELQKSISNKDEREGLRRETSKCKKKKFFSFVKKVMSKTLSKGRKSADVEQALESDCVSGLGRDRETITGSSSNYLSGCVSLNEEDDDGDESRKSQNLQWAEGKAGEDRVHIVISDENGWVFVGIYDGFNGPDAPDYLLSNLYAAVHKELEGLLWNAKFESDLVSDKAHDHSQVKSNPTKTSNMNFDSKTNQSRTLKNQLSGSNRVPSVDHSDVLKALSQALMKTEEAYLEAADKMVKENPELALMGSCVLVMLMKGEDVYVMNVGDSRAVLAQQPETELLQGQAGQVNNESRDEEEAFDGYEADQTPVLTSLQLTMDHSTNIKEEAERIRREHPDDALAISKDRVKGSLKVTRAFGAGFLKQPKWNNALLETFRIDYIGNSPYISCSPSLYHHRLGPRDNFLILSSDGLYQYFTNQEAVSHVELFMDTFPEGDPAQHLIEEVLFRAAKKAGMDFHDLLDIPQGDRRRYHDDVSIIIISLEGRIWRSSV